jgi:hypothetical protein
MHRREFTKGLLATITSVAFLDTLFAQQLLASPVKPIVDAWLKDVHTMCSDLRAAKLSPLQWQAQIDRLHHRLPLEELLKLIDFDKAVEAFEYPDLGVVTANPQLPKVEGVEKYSFIGRIFGMQQERAIIPHGHKNMTSCHRVLKGSFLLRQYDRIEDDGEHMVIRQTIEEKAFPGSFSSISDDKNNIHWLVAETPRAFTFDVIVADYNDQPTEIDNIDIYEAKKTAAGDLRVKKLRVQEALQKYGKTHH